MSKVPEISQNGSETELRRQCNRKDIARKRWAILAKALKSPISSQPSSPTDDISLRRFSTFMLLTTEEIEPEKELEGEGVKRALHRYSAKINDHLFFIDITHTIRCLTALDLIGFNNTGNVCVWPSEESLAYYALNNLSLFKNKTVLELGAGMSALAGLLIGKYGSAKCVHLTDGNYLAVNNIQMSISRNCFNCAVTCEVFNWAEHHLIEHVYDVILTADCLFFDEARLDLIDTIWQCLSFDGVCYVMAPKRAGTLNIFITLAEQKGFHCNQLIVYDQHIWERHLHSLNNSDYDPDIHYPILILLNKY